MVSRIHSLAVLGIISAGIAGCPPQDRVMEQLPGPAVPVRVAQQRPTVRPATPVEAPAAPTQAIRGATILVDAGHGGKDPGAWPQALSKLPEKTIVLDIANRLAERLAQMGANVVTTRTRDNFIELDDRAAQGDRQRVDLFISIHADSAANRSASGVSVYVARNASIQSIQAARAILAAFDRAGLETRGMKRANFRVLVGHSRPAVLIETGFLSNPGDVRLLNTSAHRNKIAQIIATAVAELFSR